MKSLPVTRFQVHKKIRQPYYFLEDVTSEKYKAIRPHKHFILGTWFA